MPNMLTTAAAVESCDS